MNQLQRQINLLLVEDNEGDIVLTREALESKNIPRKLYVCKNGIEAIQFLENILQSAKHELPEMIILDINLPRKNGHEVLSFIKNNPSLSHIPVVILTTSSSESDIKLAYQNKAKSYITKPIDISGFDEVADKLEVLWKEVINTPN